MNLSLRKFIKCGFPALNKIIKELDKKFDVEMAECFN
jgi:hypothetical protein